MLIVAGRDARLRLDAGADRVRRRGPAVRRAAGRAAPPRARPTTEARERNGEMLSARSPRSSPAPRRSGPTAPARLFGAARQATPSSSAPTSQIRASVIGAFLFPSGEVFSVLTIAAVDRRRRRPIGPAGGLTAGALIGFIFLTYRFLEPIAEFTEVLDQTQTAVAGLRRVLGVLDMPVGPPPPDAPAAAAARAARHRRPRRHVLVPDRAAIAAEVDDGVLATSTCTSRPVSRWPWSAPPVRARRRSVG